MIPSVERKTRRFAADDCEPTRRTGQVQWSVRAAPPQLTNSQTMTSGGRGIDPPRAEPAAGYPLRGDRAYGSACASAVRSGRGRRGRVTPSAPSNATLGR
jgi:hypothetical protein